MKFLRGWRYVLALLGCFAAGAAGGHAEALLTFGRRMTDLRRQLQSVDHVAEELRAVMKPFSDVRGVAELAVRIEQVAQLHETRAEVEQLGLYTTSGQPLTPEDFATTERIQARLVAAETALRELTLAVQGNLGQWEKERQQVLEHDREQARARTDTARRAAEKEALRVQEWERREELIRQQRRAQESELVAASTALRGANTDLTNLRDREIGPLAARLEEQVQQARSRDRMEEALWGKLWLRAMDLKRETESLLEEVLRFGTPPIELGAIAYVAERQLAEAKLAKEVCGRIDAYVKSTRASLTNAAAWQAPQRPSSSGASLMDMARKRRDPSYVPELLPEAQALERAWTHLWPLTWPAEPTRESVSLKWLGEVGCLEQTEHGLARLLTELADRGCPWGNRLHELTPENRQNLEQLQKDLSQFGEAFVKAGYLSK